MFKSSTQYSFFELFKQDALRWHNNGGVGPAEDLSARALLKLLYQWHGLRATYCFRLGSYYHHKHVPGMTVFFSRLMRSRYGMEMLVGADIGGGLYMPHTVGSIIVPARMGKNCSIIAGVTIGMRNEWKFPQFGDNVFIGAGARVLGGISVGDNVVIGANAVVVADVPANATVVGVPARVVRLNGRRVEQTQEPAEQSPVI